MSRWPKPPETRHRDALVKAVREALASDGIFGGTITPLFGKGEMAVEAEALGLRSKLGNELSTGQMYAAVNTMMAQPWMREVGSYTWTLTTSARAWLTQGRFELENAIRASLPHADYGRMGGRGNKKA